MVTDLDEIPSTSLESTPFDEEFALKIRIRHRFPTVALHILYWTLFLQAFIKTLDPSHRMSTATTGKRRPIRILRADSLPTGLI